MDRSRTPPRRLPRTRLARACGTIGPRGRRLLLLGAGRNVGRRTLRLCRGVRGRQHWGQVFLRVVRDPLRYRPCRATTEASGWPHLRPAGSGGCNPGRRSCHLSGPDAQWWKDLFEPVATGLKPGRQLEVFTEVFGVLVYRETWGISGDLEQHPARLAEVDRTEVVAVQHRRNAVA